MSKQEIYCKSNRLTKQLQRRDEEGKMEDKEKYKNGQMTDSQKVGGKNTKQSNN